MYRNNYNKKCPVNHRHSFISDHIFSCGIFSTHKETTTKRNNPTGVSFFFCFLHCALAWQRELTKAGFTNWATSSFYYVLLLRYIYKDVSVVTLCALLVFILFLFLHVSIFCDIQYLPHASWISATWSLVCVTMISLFMSRPESGFSICPTIK